MSASSSLHLRKSMPTRQHPRHERQEKARHLHWTLKFCLLAVIAFTCYSIAHHIRITSSEHDIRRLPPETKALVEYPPPIPETELEPHLDACVFQIIHLIASLLHLSYITDFLPSTFATELERLRHNMRSVVYLKHHLDIDTEDLLFKMYAAQLDCIPIDASFEKYQLDVYHNSRTLICVYIQDLINKYYPPLFTSQSVSCPFFSSRERAALLKRDRWSTAIGRVIDEVHPALTQLTIIGPRLFSASVSINLLFSHLFNITALSVTQPSHFFDIRALLGFSSHTPTTPCPALVNLTDSLKLAADTARTTAHLLHSVDAALTAVHNLEQTLKTGPWLNTHVITAEQWTAQEKRMRRWKLKAADEVMRLEGYTWEADTEGKEYSWFFGGARTVRVEVKE